MTLDEARAELLNRSHRTDLTNSQLDSFIDFALSRINASLHAIAGELSVVVSEALPTLPADFGQVRSVTRPAPNGGFVELRPFQPGEAELWSQSTGGDAIGYIIVGNEIEFYPVDAKDMTLTYQATPLLPTTGTGTNWALTGFFDLVINASLVELFDWEQNESQAVRYENKYLAAVARYEDDEERKRYGPGIQVSSNYNAVTRPPRSM